MSTSTTYSDEESRNTALSGAESYKAEAQRQVSCTEQARNVEVGRRTVLGGLAAGGAAAMLLPGSVSADHGDEDPLATRLEQDLEEIYDDEDVDDRWVNLDSEQLAGIAAVSMMAGPFGLPSAAVAGGAATGAMLFGNLVSDVGDWLFGDDTNLDDQQLQLAGDVIMHADSLHNVSTDLWLQMADAAESNVETTIHAAAVFNALLPELMDGQDNETAQDAVRDEIRPRAALQQLSIDTAVDGWIMRIASLAARCRAADIPEQENPVTHDGRPIIDVSPIHISTAADETQWEDFEVAGEERNIRRHAGFALVIGDQPVSEYGDEEVLDVDPDLADNELVLAHPALNRVDNTGGLSQNDQFVPPPDDPIGDYTGSSSEGDDTYAYAYVVDYFDDDTGGSSPSDHPYADVEYHVLDRVHITSPDGIDVDTPVFPREDFENHDFHGTLSDSIGDDQLTRWYLSYRFELFEGLGPQYDDYVDAVYDEYTSGDLDLDELIDPAVWAEAVAIDAIDAGSRYLAGLQRWLGHSVDSMGELHIAVHDEQVGIGDTSEDAIYPDAVETEVITAGARALSEIEDATVSVVTTARTTDVDWDAGNVDIAPGSVLDVSVHDPRDVDDEGNEVYNATQVEYELASDTVVVDLHPTTSDYRAEVELPSDAETIEAVWLTYETDAGTHTELVQSSFADPELEDPDADEQHSYVSVEEHDDVPVIYAPARLVTEWQPSAVETLGDSHNDVQLSTDETVDVHLDWNAYHSARSNETEREFVVIDETAELAVDVDDTDVTDATIQAVEFVASGGEDYGVQVGEAVTYDTLLTELNVTDDVVVIDEINVGYEDDADEFQTAPTNASSTELTVDDADDGRVPVEVGEWYSVDDVESGGDEVALIYETPWEDGPDRWVDLDDSQHFKIVHAEDSDGNEVVEFDLPEPHFYTLDSEHLQEEIDRAIDITVEVEEETGDGSPPGGGGGDGGEQGMLAVVAAVIGGGVLYALSQGSSD